MRDAREDFAKQCRADLEETATRLEQQIADAKDLIRRSTEHLTKVRQHLAELDRQASNDA